MSRGHYRVGATTPEAESSGIGGVVLIGIGVGLGWLWVNRETAREKRAAWRGPDVSDIEALIRARGISPYSYGLSGQPRERPRQPRDRPRKKAG